MQHTVLHQHVWCSSTRNIWNTVEHLVSCDISRVMSEDIERCAHWTLATSNGHPIDVSIGKKLSWEPLWVALDAGGSTSDGFHLSAWWLWECGANSLCDHWSSTRNVNTSRWSEHWMLARPCPMVHIGASDGLECVRISEPMDLFVWGLYKYVLVSLGSSLLAL